MLRKALEYIVGLSKPETLEIGGETYSDRSLYRISHNPQANPIELHTLTSLIDYIKSGIDTMRGHMIIHVVSPTMVRMYSQLDYERERESIAVVRASVPEFKFGHFIEHESFCIGVQSKFIKNEDRALLLKFAGTVESGSVAEYGDDGITQKATVKTGVSSKSDAIIPSPVCLIPFRTFPEVEQPASSFVFRMKEDKYSGVQCGLFEADGGAWMNFAMDCIKFYLEKNLDDVEGFTVIS